MKTTKRKYFQGYKKLKHVKMFENFFLAEGDFYFDEHDSVDNYEIKIISKEVKDKEDFDEHILKVTGLPRIGGRNTRNSTWHEILYFIAKYAKEKDDEFAQYVSNLSLSDELTVIEDGAEFGYAMSDISDHMK